MFSIIMILDSSGGKENSDYKVWVYCLSRWIRLRGEDVPSPLGRNKCSAFEILSQNVAFTCSLLGWCWSLWEIYSERIHVQHHHFQTSLGGVAGCSYMFMYCLWLYANSNVITMKFDQLRNKLKTVLFCNVNNAMGKFWCSILFT